MKIPIRNLYYLLCYAWDQFKEGESIDLGSEPPSRIHDLFGHVRSVGVARILRRGLHREYVVESDEVAGILGKLRFSETLKRNLLSRGRTFCEYDELSHDVLHNRIIKSTLGLLKRIPDLDAAVRSSVNLVYQRMGDVTDINVRPSMFRQVRIHRNNRLYAFVLSVCRLIVESTLVDHSSGAVRFKDIREDKTLFWKVFENFVANFFRREQQVFAVSSPTIRWRETLGAESDLKLLPLMRTDVVLKSHDRTVIVDTKFYQQTMQEHYGSRAVHSGNLYQVLTYLDNWGEADADPRAVEGMLLYPVVQDAYRLDYVINGRRMQVVTVDLSQPWERIHAEMLGLVA